MLTPLRAACRRRVTKTRGTNGRGLSRPGPSRQLLTLEAPPRLPAPPRQGENSLSGSTGVPAKGSPRSRHRPTPSACGDPPPPCPVCFLARVWLRAAPELRTGERREARHGPPSKGPQPSKGPGHSGHLDPVWQVLEKALGPQEEPPALAGWRVREASWRRRPLSRAWEERRICPWQGGRKGDSGGLRGCSYPRATKAAALLGHFHLVTSTWAEGRGSVRAMRTVKGK
nr:WAS/WASL-interacting protein family member 3-like [Microcebus murinus]